MDEKGFLGKEIGNYRIIAEINSGAYGSVYKAEHTHLNGRIVAIKLLHTYMGSIIEREQFVQEAQFLALLEHPHILPLLDFGFSGNQPYLITRYAAGGSLRDLLMRQAPLPLEKAITILVQVGQALDYAHQSNIIHRDLKPENILFNAQGDVLLADFGIATMLSSTSVKHLTIISGTPSYMAPEQFQGTISKEGDQYALGCIAYELVTGHVPFTAPDFLSLGFQHLTQQPLAPTSSNPQVPVAMEAAILKALAKQRSERYANISAFLAALQVPFTQSTAQHSAPAPSNIQPMAPAIAPAVPLPSHSPLQTKEEWIVTGNRYYHNNRYEDALAAYNQAIRLDPRYALAYYSKGAVLNGLQHYDEALVAYEKAIRFDPRYIPAYHGKGFALTQLQRHKEALSTYEKTIRLDPRYAPAYHGKGVALTQLQRYKEALEAHEQASRLDPRYALAYYGKGVALLELQRYEEALEAHEQAIRLDPRYALAYYGKGVALSNLKRNQEALGAYEQTLRLAPHFAKAYNNKGITLYELKRYEEALEAQEQAIQLDPYFALAYHDKGDALQRLGRRKEAQQAYEKARRLKNNP